MRGVVLFVVLPRLCLGVTDVGGKSVLKVERGNCKDVHRRQVVPALHIPLGLKGRVVAQLTAALRKFGYRGKNGAERLRSWW